jgi:Tol biopolymer transport system component
MLTESGAKLLDFGLAKIGGTHAPSRVFPSMRGSAHPTLESLTEEGMLLGTLEYMAPEQLEGKEADPRTDIFALGVMIYEMSTAKKAFEGDSKASLIAKILTYQPPPIGTIQLVSPPELDAVVQRCLAKKPEERWQKAAELTSELQQIVETVLPMLKAQKREKAQSGEEKEIESEAVRAVPVPIQEPQKFLSRLIRSRAWEIGFAGILLALIIGSLVLRQAWRQPGKPPEKPKEPSSKLLTSYSSDNALNSAAISPDGKYLAFCSKGRLFIQIVSSKERRSLPLPEGFFPAAVSWFPDGTKLLLGRLERQWIQMKGETRRMSDRSQWSLSILGGTPQKVADHASRASVSPDGSQVAFSRLDPERETFDLWLVNASGEGPRKLRAPTQPKESYLLPVWSSNGQRLFYVHNSQKDASIESCDVRGQDVTTTFSTKVGIAFCGSPDGRIFFAMQEPGIQALSNPNLWEIKVDAATGRPLSEARRLTQWSGFSTRAVSDLSMTADGRWLVLLRWNAQADVFVAEAEAGGKSMKNPRRLTLEESDDAAWDWTADSRAILLVSYRNGNGDIFKQDMSQTEAEAIVTGPEDQWHPNFSPDWRFILYLVSERRGALAGRLMRVPVGGGPPELVLKGEKIKAFSCAREANLCVVAEEVEGKQVLSTFDPLKGGGEKLPMTDCPNFERGILSSQGRLIEKMKSGPDGLYLRVRSLRGGPVQEITFKNLNGDYQFQGWSLDGKGIYLQDENPSLFATVVYADLDGHSQVLWQTGSNPGWRGMDVPVASPDGRYLAITAVYDETNAWLLENF